MDPGVAGARPFWPVRPAEEVAAGVVGVRADVAGHGAAVVEADAPRAAEAAARGHVTAEVAARQRVVDAAGRFRELVAGVVLEDALGGDGEAVDDMGGARALREVVEVDVVADRVVVVAEVLVGVGPQQRVPAVEPERLRVVRGGDIDAVAELAVYFLDPPEVSAIPFEHGRCHPAWLRGPRAAFAMPSSRH